MDFWETSKPPEVAAEADPSNYRHPSADDPHWERCFDPSRGERLLRRDAAGRPAELIGADGARLRLSHDEAGNLRELSAGTFGLAFAGQTRKWTFAVTDPVGRTEVRLDRGGRRRRLTRGVDALTLELDENERTRRVDLPGSDQALVYDWDEDGCCTIRGGGGARVLVLAAADGARRVSPGDGVWWDERVTPARVAIAATIAGETVETIEIALSQMAATLWRRRHDGSGERFARDPAGRLSAWTRIGADGSEIVHPFVYRGGELVEGWSGIRSLDRAGRVTALAKPDGRMVRYRYDACGRRVERLCSGARTRYRYDPLGNLVEVVAADGGRTRYAFDGIGRRVAVIREGEAIRHEHRDECGRLWAVTDGEGRALHSYVWVGDRIAARIDGPIGDPVAEAYCGDPLGTPLGVLARTADGWRYEALDVLPFGDARDEARPGIYGHFADPETGLVHFGARELDPELGLFLTPDPWHGGADDPRLLSGAPTAMLAAARERPAEGIHDYALCQFDPLGRTDRDGHVSGGDVVLHIFRWMLLPTWGFPLTSISLFFFTPFNLYAEIVGLIVFGFKQLCENKSHPWGNHTIVKSQWLLGSTRQFTFALGLNGFLPRVVSGGGLSGDRAVTIGNVIWISRGELKFLGRPEVIEIDKIAGDGGALKPFNDDPRRQSVLALIAADKKARQKLMFAPWSRGYGDAVALRAGPVPGATPVQSFADTGAKSFLHLFRPIPEDIDVPDEADDDEKLEVVEYTRAAGDPEVDLETPAQLWFALSLPKDTDFAKDQWLKITAPKAPAPVPEPAFRRIRDLLPARDEVAAILSAELPARFQTTPPLDHDLRIDQVDAVATATPSAGWIASPVAAKTLNQTFAAGAAIPALEVGGLVRCVATTGVAPTTFVGVPPPAGAPLEDTTFAQIAEIRVELELAPDTTGIAAGDELHRRRVEGATFSGQVAKAGERGSIKLATPHPPVKKDELLIVSRAGLADLFFRATADVVAHKLSIDPELPAAFVPADKTDVQIQRTADTGGDAATDKATVAAVAGAKATIKPRLAALIAADNLVRVGEGAAAQLRRVKAVGAVELDLGDDPVGTGPFALTAATLPRKRNRKEVSLAPTGRFLKWDHLTAAPPKPSSLGNWPDRIIGIQEIKIPTTIAPPGVLAPGLFASPFCAFYARWPGGVRPATLHEECLRGFQTVTSGADEFVVLEEPLPIGKGLNWIFDPDQHDPSGLVVPAGTLTLKAFELAKSGAERTRCLAHEPEALVPDDPTIHDTHRRTLIEHEIHHTVQCNFWGPLMTALPLQGVVMTVADVVEAAGNDVGWLNEVERDANGNAPTRAEGHIPDNTELNWLELLSIGGIMQLAWKYIFLLPFRGIDGFDDTTDQLDFQDFNKVFNPLSSFLITSRLPQVDANAPANDRWLAALGQLASNAFDLRSWTPALGFVPGMLPDNATNFIEQQASRASGDLYSAIVTANDRHNLTKKFNIFFKIPIREVRDRSADLHVGVGRAVRLLHFFGSRSDRSFADTGDVPGNPLVLRSGVFVAAPSPRGFSRDGQRADRAIGITAKAAALFPVELYDATGAGVSTVQIDSPPGSGLPPGEFHQVTGIAGLVTPKPRAIVPLPPRVNRTIGIYLIAGSPGTFTVEAQPKDSSGSDTETVELTVADEVKLGEEIVPWAMPAFTPVPPPVPAPPPAMPAGPPLKRFIGEVQELRVNAPKDMKGPAFIAAGIAGFSAHVSDPAIVVAENSAKTGWMLTMPAAKTAAPARVRIFRTFKKNDADFDLKFDAKEVPSLSGVSSYLDGDVFVVVRDFLLEVEDIPVLPDATTVWDVGFELKLPIRLAATVRPVVIPRKGGDPVLQIVRLGDDGRGEKWRIGPGLEPLGEDAEYDVTVPFGPVGAAIVRKFKLTLTAALSVTATAAEFIPGRPLELTIAKGTPPYTLEVTPKPTALSITQPTPTTAVLLAEAAPDEVANLFVTVTDSSSPKLKGGRHIALQTMPPYLAPNLSADYLEYVRPPTFGLATPLINGRSSNGAGPDIDLTEPLDAMERAVSALGAGDTVYLAAWLFEAATTLRVGGIAGVTTWGELFANKAAADVKIRILFNDFDPISGMDKSLKTLALDPVDAIIAALPAAKRDNLKYVVSLHPAFIGSFKAFFAGQGARNIHVASHHQKFMVVRRGDSLTAFCGGIDIESRKTPAKWKYGGLIAWHDIHVQLEGPVTRDLEREFVARWNRERGASTRPARPGWAALETLTETALSPTDDTPARKVHSLQMVRTVAVDGGSSLYTTKRKDVFETYRKAIRQAKSFIYMENQYFRSKELGDAIAAAGKANSALVLIMVVVGSAAEDDGDNALTQHGNFLQFETYDPIFKAFGGRAGFYSMTDRAVHSKFVMIDDQWMTIGSANANGRSFELDSELNVQIGDNGLTKAFRSRLWAHNLGVPIATAAGWKVGDFLAEWNAVATANRGLAAAAMAGEGVIPFDYTATKGKAHGSLPDALVDLEFGSGEADSDRIA